MSEAEFKQRCIASGGVYEGPANNSGLAYPSPHSGPGKCNWEKCGYKEKRIFWKVYVRWSCEYHEQINMARS